MTIFLKIGVGYLKMVYAILKLFPQQKKIVFISRQNDQKSLDFTLIEKHLKNKNINNIVFLTKKIDKNFISYILFMHKKMYHLATSKVCVLDSYVVTVSVLNHRNLKVIQLWHSMAAIKKFGYQTLGKEMGRNIEISKILKMHNNYDIIISGSKAMEPHFKEAFNSKNTKVIGLPRIDYLINNHRSLYEKYSRSKPIVVYIPTFRDSVEKLTEKLILNFDFNNYDLVVRLHPKTDFEIKDQRLINLQNLSTFDLIAIADVVITDYSAVLIEAAAINKKVFLYIDDYDEYIEKNGLNLDLKKDFSAIIIDITKFNFDVTKSYKWRVIEKIKNTYIANQTGECTKEIVNIIMENMGDEI